MCINAEAQNGDVQSILWLSLLTDTRIGVMLYIQTNGTHSCHTVMHVIFFYIKKMFLIRMIVKI